MSVLKIKREDGTWESISGGSSSSVDLDDTLTQSGKAADAKVVGDKFDDLVDIIVHADEPVGAEDGTLWVDLDEESVGGSGGSSYEIPTFNLTEMGLPAIPMDGSMPVRSDADFTELKEALSNGIVNLRYAVTMSGYTFYGVTKACATYNEIYDCYQVFTSQMVEVGGGISLFGLGINVFSACAIGYCREIQYALPDAEEATF